MKTENNLPKGFEEEVSSNVFLNDGEEIFENFCVYCTKKLDCDTAENIKFNLEGILPNYWSEKFVKIKIPTPYNFFKDYEKKNLCVDYKNPQLKLQGFDSCFSEGIERLIELAEEEKIKYIRENGKIVENNF